MLDSSARKITNNSTALAQGSAFWQVAQHDVGGPKVLGGNIQGSTRATMRRCGFGVRFTILTVAVLLAVTVATKAQISEGGTPYSIRETVFPPTIQPLVLPPVDRTLALAEDEAEEQAARSLGQPVPRRFGIGVDVSLDLSNSGEWTDLPAGARLWRLRILSAGAYSINLIFDDFFMPDGAKLFLYNRDHTMVLGAFTSTNNKPYRRFSTAPVAGHDVTLEYYEPETVRHQGRVRLSRIIRAYRNLFGARTGGDLEGYGDSSSCNVNVNCSQGAAWQDEKRSVAMVITSGGTRICSGALVNNALQDYEPYFLTAFHCMEYPSANCQITQQEIDFAEDWVFMFGYESPTCSDQDGPTYKTISGATLRARDPNSDFALVELSAKPPASYSPYYAGWSRRSSGATSVVGIHHPGGDIKKISLDDESVTLMQFRCGASSDGWRVASWDTGTTEGGSSGSPLFDQNSRIVGQDEGARPGYNTPCTAAKETIYGAFHLSWTGGGSAATRLKDWLDPNNSNPSTLNAIEGSPTVPGNLLITNLGQDLELVNLAWQASTPSPITYKVERCQVSNPLYSCSSWSEIGSTSSTSFTDTQTLIEVPPAPGEPYFRYRVRAVRYGVYSNYSNTAELWATDLYPKRGNWISQREPGIPTEFSLAGNYPNPFNPSTEIRIAVAEATRASLVVYDALGREVTRLVDDVLEPGYYGVTWNGSDMPSGVYVYRFSAGGFVASASMVLLK
jgi:hypothetical protein